MSFIKDSSQEYVLIGGKWVRRSYTPRKHDFGKKKKAKREKEKTPKISFRERKAIQKKRVKDSAATTKGRKASAMTPGEKRIADFLISNNVRFSREQYFSNLFNPKTDRLLYFDFYLPKYNLAIEYDGLHHFRNVYGEKYLQAQRERDNAKWQYCRKHKIHLLRINCFDTDKIEEIICKRLDEIAPIR